MLKSRQIELKEANEFVALYHRHHKKIQGHRFSVGAEHNGVLCGVAIVGRPAARLTDPKKTLEVTRLCTDGTKNACSFLYATTAKIGKLLGYIKIQTFILETEFGTSLKAAGWKMEQSACGGGTWVRKGRERRTDQPTCLKQKYSKELNELLS